MDGLTTESSFDSQATSVINEHGLLFFIRHVIHGCLFNQALADVLSTSARIKCSVLYVVGSLL